MRYFLLISLYTSSLFSNCNLDIESKESLFNAAKIGNMEIIQKYISKNINSNCYNQFHTSVLLKATFYNQLPVIKYLIDSGSKIDDGDIDNMTPLAAAVKNNYTETAKYLLNKGANYNIEYFAGLKTPYSTAINNDNLEIFTTMVEKGLNINTVIGDKKPLLSIAIMNGSNKIANWLIDNGADINLENKYGKTPLMYAAHFQRVELLKKLLKHKVKINTKTNDGRTVLDYITFDHADNNPAIERKILKLIQQEMQK